MLQSPVHVGWMEQFGLEVRPGNPSPVCLLPNLASSVQSLVLHIAYSRLLVLASSTQTARTIFSTKRSQITKNSSRPVGDFSSKNTFFWAAGDSPRFSAILREEPREAFSVVLSPRVDPAKAPRSLFSGFEPSRTLPRFSAILRDSPAILYGFAQIGSGSQLAKWAGWWKKCCVLRCFARILVFMKILRTFQCFSGVLSFLHLVKSSGPGSMDSLLIMYCQRRAGLGLRAWGAGPMNSFLI